MRFVAKLSPDGSQLLYSTLLGGGGEQAGGIVVDASGSAVVTGQAGANFPVTQNAFQTGPGACDFNHEWSSAFITRLSADGGSLVYSTFLGDYTAGTDVALASNGDSWIVGKNLCSFPVTPDALQPNFGDSFLARLDTAGNLTYATYLGERQVISTVRSNALDSQGNLYLTGAGGGLDQPPSPGAYRSAPLYRESLLSG